MDVSGARETTESGEAASRAYSLATVPAQPFGRYTLIGKLGHGGMAEVNLAVSEGKAGFRKLVVIKRLHRHLAMEPGFVDMFLDEARLAARLNHPHCVQTYEVGEWEGNHFLAMEYLDGQGLERLLRISGERDEPIPVEIAARIVADALDGLAYAHELTDFDGTPLGVVHRDVSPQNIFVTYDGMVKLLDFGIAKAATHVVETKTGVIKGKYAYIAPEQALGEGVDQRSDLWSMGVVLWEVLTGRRLFKSVNELATLKQTIDGEIKLPSAFRPELPTDLDTICMRALQREPGERYQTAQEMKDDLDRYLLSVPKTPGRKHVARLMRKRFAGVIETHQATLARCLQSSEAAVSDSSIERLVGPGPVSTTSSVSGIRASGNATPTPTPAPSDVPLVTPTPSPGPMPAVATSAPPAEARRGGGLAWKLGLVAVVVLIAAAVAVVLPLGGDAPGEPGADAEPALAAGGASRDTLGEVGVGSAAGPTDVGGDDPGDEELGRPDVGDEALGDEALGDEALGDEALGQEDPGQEDPGRPDVGGEEREIRAARARRLAAARALRRRRRREAEQTREPSEEPAPPAETDPSTASEGPGFLTLATTPWTHVSLDGRDLGTTPLIRAELPPGTHRLRLVNREQGIDETYRVTIRSGEAVSRRLGLR